MGWESEKKRGYRKHVAAEVTRRTRSHRGNPPPYVGGYATIINLLHRDNGGRESRVDVRGRRRRRRPRLSDRMILRFGQGFSGFVWLCRSGRRVLFRAR